MLTLRAGGAGFASIGLPPFWIKRKHNIKFGGAGVEEKKSFRWCRIFYHNCSPWSLQPLLIALTLNRRFLKIQKIQSPKSQTQNPKLHTQIPESAIQNSWRVIIIDWTARITSSAVWGRCQNNSTFQRMDCVGLVWNGLDCTGSD